MTDEPTRSTEEPQVRYKAGRVTKRHTWQSSKTKRKIAHFMESETSAFCGRPLLHTKPITIPGWDPEEHPDCVCPVCLGWWRRVAKPCGKCGKVDEPAGENKNSAKV